MQKVKVKSEILRCMYTLNFFSQYSVSDWDLSCPHTCIFDRSLSTDLICTDQIGQISASVWGAADQIWHIRSLVLIFHHVGIPYPPANIIAKCVAGTGRDVTDTGDDRFMDTDFITCTIYWNI